MQTLGLPQSCLETCVPRVRSVDSGQVESVSKKYVPPSQVTIVVVGDASKIGDALNKFGEVTVTKAN